MRMLLYPVEQADGILEMKEQSVLVAPEERAGEEADADGVDLSF